MLENKGYEQEILSICIPTKDRDEKLVATVSEFMKLNNFNKVRIYISDNSEHDGAEKKIMEKFGNNQSIIYFKNPSPSKTYQTNFLNLLREAKGEYIWFFGDDDLPMEGALDKIFQYLGESPDFIIAKYVGYDKELKKVLPYWKITIDEDLRIERSNFLETLTSTYPYNGCISFIIMRREHLLKALECDYIDLNSNYVQTFAWSVALLALPGPLFGFSIGTPLVKWREEFGDSADKKKWSKSRFLLALEHRDIFVTLAKKLQLPILLEKYDGPFQYRMLVIALDWKFRNHLSLDDAVAAAKGQSTIKLHIKLLWLILGLSPLSLLKKFKGYLSLIYGFTTSGSHSK